jgi:hypothetical protein
MRRPPRAAAAPPTPPGGFRPTLPVYGLADAVFGGSCELPPIVRAA